MAKEQQQETEIEKVEFANKPALFGKWDYEGVVAKDACFKDYVAVATTKA